MKNIFPKSVDFNKIGRIFALRLNSIRRYHSIAFTTIRTYRAGSFLNLTSGFELGRTTEKLRPASLYLESNMRPNPKQSKITRKAGESLTQAERNAATLPEPDYKRPESPEQPAKAEGLITTRKARQSLLTIISFRTPEEKAEAFEYLSTYFDAVDMLIYEIGKLQEKLKTN